MHEGIHPDASRNEALDYWSSIKSLQTHAFNLDDQTVKAHVLIPLDRTVSGRSGKQTKDR